MENGTPASASGINSKNEGIVNEQIKFYHDWNK